VFGTYAHTFFSLVLSDSQHIRRVPSRTESVCVHDGTFSPGQTRARMHQPTLCAARVCFELFIMGLCKINERVFPLHSPQLHSAPALLATHPHRSPHNPCKDKFKNCQKYKFLFKNVSFGAKIATFAIFYLGFGLGGVEIVWIDIRSMGYLPTWGIQPFRVNSGHR
jgi:hypothetical protein